MEIEPRNCCVCGVKIPTERIEAIPDTLVCVACSRRMGGEYQLEISVSGTGKAGSLKKTGQEVSVRRVPKRWH